MLTSVDRSATWCTDFFDILPTVIHLILIVIFFKCFNLKSLNIVPLKYVSNTDIMSIVCELHVNNGNFYIFSGQIYLLKCERSSCGVSFIK